jgi:hypothetical protein
LLAAIAQCALAAELYLAPGATVTILDASDPTLRIVMTAPPTSTLDLSELLTLKPEESVRSIVTRFQPSSASGMTRNPDGSITLGSAPAPLRQPTPGLAGGTLIRDGDKWTLHPGTQPAQQVAKSAPAPAQQSTQRTIFKAGVTKEQAERDIAQCRGHAEKSLPALANANDRVNAYNAAMMSCLQSFGYEIRS